MPVADEDSRHISGVRNETAIIDQGCNNSAETKGNAHLRIFQRRRRYLQALWIGLDIFALSAAALGASLVLGRYPSTTAWLLIGLMTLIRLAAFIRVGMYRAVLRYSGIHTQFCATVSIAIGSTVAIAGASMLQLDQQAGLGRAFWVLEGLLSVMVIGGMRLTARMILERISNRTQKHGARCKRVLIFGAGSLGELALRDLQRVPGYQPVGFIDDDSARHKSVIHGKKVFGSFTDFADICDRVRPDLVVVAISDPPPDQIKALFKAAMNRGIHMVLAKGVSTALDEDSTRLGLRDLALEDLLKRPTRKLDPTPVRQLLSGKRVMITGAGGSIGSELCRQVARLDISAIDLVDHSEFHLYEIEQQLTGKHPHLCIRPHLISLTDRSATMACLTDTRPDIIFHAAAYKHVPLVEVNPFRGIINNVGGFINLLDAAEANATSQLVLISSDKAVRPTNVMGASKRICEILVQSRANSLMRLCAVRFGNVLGSSGSVVPRFIRQIDSGGPVTVTHPDMTRYFMLIPEAVGLVLQAGARSSDQASEIFILDMGEPVKIAELAKQLIFMYGKDPERDTQVVFTGLRPGEKLFEELLTDDADHHTDIPDITVASSVIPDRARTDTLCESLLKACQRADYGDVVLALLDLVPEWQPSENLRIRAGREHSDSKQRVS